MSDSSSKKQQEKIIFRHCWQENLTYCWLFRMLLIDYWFQLSGVNFEDIQKKYWQSFKRVTSWASTLFTAVCLEEIIWTDFILISRSCIETLKLSIVCQNWQERKKQPTLSSLFAPGGAFYLSNFTTPGGLLLFQASNRVFFSLNFPEVCVCCWAVPAKTHTATHTDGDRLERFCLLPGIEGLAAILTDWGVEGRHGGPSAPHSVKSLHWFNKTAATVQFMWNHMQILSLRSFLSSNINNMNRSSLKNLSF